MVQVLAYVCAYVFIVNSIQECLGGPTDPSLRIPVEKPMSSRAQGDSDQRSPHQKEAVQMKSQDLVSDIQNRFLCLLLTGCVTVDSFLNYSEPKYPHLGNESNGSHLPGIFFEFKYS